MFQDKAAVRTAIIKTILELGRSATPSEIVCGVWYRCRVDGTRHEVGDAVEAEIREMEDEGILNVDPDQRGPFGERRYNADVLTLMSMI